MNAADFTFGAQTDEVEPPALLDWTELAKVEPDEPVLLAGPLFPQGEVTLASGHGGVHKSRFCKQAAVSIGLGIDFFGLATRQRRVGYLSFEDNTQTLHREFAAFCAAAGKTLLDLKGRVFLFDGTRSDSVIFSEQVDQYLTDLYWWAKKVIAETGIEVLIVDGVADVYDASESDRAKVKRFVRAILRLTPPTGAVILIGHVNREIARNFDTTEGYSGSTAWHNAVRSRLYMRAASNDLTCDTFIVELQKNQFGRPGFTLRVRFDETRGVLITDERPTPGTVEPNEADLDALVAIIRGADECGDAVPAASTGQRTAFHVMSVQPTFPAIFSGQKASRAFRQAIERLRAAGRIRVRSGMGPSRHRREVFYAPD